MEVHYSALSGWLTLNSAKFGDRILESGDHLTQQEMQQYPVVTFDLEIWWPPRYILVLTHRDKNYPELGEYLHWVVRNIPVRQDARSDQGEEIIPYKPPVQGDTPVLYTFTLYAQHDIQRPQDLSGLPVLDDKHDRRLNFNSEDFKISNDLQVINTIYFKV